MIIKTINTNYTDHEKTRKHDVPKHTSTTSTMPFSSQREYMRALNFTKVERLLSKPFIKAWSDAKEGVLQIQKHSTSDIFVTTSYDGSIIVYDMNKQDCISNKNIKENEFNKSDEAIKIEYSKSVSFLGDNVLIGMRNNVEMYDMCLERNMNVYRSGGIVNHVYGKDDFLVSSTCGVEIFDSERITPKFLFDQFGSSTFSCFDNFSKIIGSCGEDGSIYLVDNRIEKEFATIKCGTKTNSISFSPDERYFVSANEDTNAYLHDLRYVDRIRGTFRHHVNALTDVKYRPCGTEIVTASYDKTIRIFKVDERKSRDVYYNKRMGSVFSVCYNTSGNKILSTSDDGSVRVWRSEASLRENIEFRELNAIKYGKALKEKYKDVGEIKRIDRHRFLPKKLKAEMKNRNEHHRAILRKSERNKKLQQEKENETEEKLI